MRPALLCLLLVLAPPAARAASYGGKAPEPELAPPELALAQQVRASIRTSAGVAPGLDARLARAARELAGWAAQGDDAAAGTARDAVRLALAHQGSILPEPTPFCVRASSVKLAFDRLALRAAEETKGHPPERIGVGVVQRGTVVFAVILLGTRRAEIDPFPVMVGIGSTQVLSGRLIGLGAAQVHVTPPGGAPVRLPADRDDAASFRARIAFATRGRYVIEVLGSGARGPEVAAMLTVFAGGDAPSDPTSVVARTEPADVAGKEALVAREVNALRAARGLPPLHVDPRLAKVARSYAQELARTGEVAHHSEESGELGDRLGRAGYAYVRAGENLAQAPTALEAHRGTVESPGHLANLVDPDLTHAGFGVAAARTAGGSSTLYLVEVMARPPASSADLADDALQALQGRRRELGLPALLSDERLLALAREQLARLVEIDDPGHPARDLPPRALAALGPGFAAGAEVLVAAEPSDAATADCAREPRWERVAVAAAPTRSDSHYGKGRMFVVIVVAARGGPGAVH